MATIEGRILECVFTRISLTREAIMIITRDDRSKYDYAFFRRTLEKLIQDKYLRVEKKTSTDGRQVKTIDHIIITPKGIGHLVDMALEDKERREKDGPNAKQRTMLPWLAYIRKSWIESSLAPYADVLSVREKTYKISEASLAAEMVYAWVIPRLHSPDSCDDLIGFNDVHHFVSGGDIARTAPSEAARKAIEKKSDTASRNIRNGKRTYQSLIKDAITEWHRADPEGWKKYNEEMRNIFSRRFVSPLSVKAVLADRLREDRTSLQDINRVRFDGLIQSKRKTVLMYCCHEPNLTWPHDAAFVERQLIDKWQMYLRPEYREKCDMKHYGALLVQNPRSFKNIFCDQNHARKKRNSLGECFESLYIVPLTYEGLTELNTIVYHSLEYEVNERKQYILREDFNSDVRFRENKDYQSDVLLFVGTDKKTGEECYYALGTWMDVNQMHRIEQIAAMQKKAKPGTEKKIGVLCFEWQSDYYRYLDGDIGILATDSLYGWDETED